MATYVTLGCAHDLRSLITEDVYEGYGKANFLGIDIIICRETGYINFTKLMEQDGKKIQ